MATSSLSALTIPSLKIQSQSQLGSSKLCSLQVPSQLTRIQFGNKGVSFNSKPRISHLFAAKKQTFANLDELLEKADKPVLVDFYATWCGPCQLMAPILDQVSTVLKDTIQVVKIDTERYPIIADKYRIEALPTFIIFKDGKPHDRFEGALTKDRFIERIESSLQVKQ